MFYSVMMHWEIYFSFYKNEKYIEKNYRENVRDGRLRAICAYVSLWTNLIAGDQEKPLVVV